MPQTLYNNIQVPINPDAYALTADLATMGNSTRTVFYVNSQSQRDALPGSPNAYLGMTVCLGYIAGLPLETWDGTRWNRQSIANIGQGTAVPIFAGGVSTVTTNNNGDFSVILPTAFGTALKASTMNDATDPASLGAVLIKNTFGSSDKTKLTGRAYNTSGAALNTITIAVSWTAVGY